MFKFNKNKLSSTAAILLLAASSQPAAAEVTDATRSLEPEANKPDAPFAKSGKNSKSRKCAETMTYYINSGAAQSNTVTVPSGVPDPACGQVSIFPGFEFCVGSVVITQPTFFFESQEDALNNSEDNAVGILTSTQMIVGVLEDGRILSKRDGAFVFFGEGSNQDNLGAEILTSDLETIYDGGISSAIVGGTGPYAGIEGNVFIIPPAGPQDPTPASAVFCVL